MEEKRVERKILREFLEEYLILKGVNPQKNFRCFSPTHEDKNPSMSFYKPAGICKCFACGEKYDIFKLVGLEYGIFSCKEQEEKVLDLYLHPEKISSINEGIYSKKNVEVFLEYGISPMQEKERKEVRNYNYSRNYSKYYMVCKNKIKMSSYLETRGISEEIIRKHSIGYDPNFKDYITKQINPSLIIPISEKCFVSRSVLENVEHKNRYRRIGNGLLGENLLKETEGGIYIVEGEIDALSIETVGGKAIAAPTQYFSVLIEKIKESGKAHIFYLMMDQDEQGKKAQEHFFQELSSFSNIQVIKTNMLEEYKDANEFLQKNPKEFKKIVEHTPFIYRVLQHIEENKALENTFQYIYSFQKKGKYKEEIALRCIEKNILKGLTLDEKRQIEKEDSVFIRKMLSKKGLEKYKDFIMLKELDDILGFFQEEKLEKKEEKRKIPRKIKVQEEVQR
ncbi:DNA primase [Fusobacterium necrophorum]|nr:toprim domain-containing protein [Fusobacterium necrophorum]MBR8733429.1 DNA primase [Fusobacterium necrophorum]MBR8789606.1 DNA primase [Fusobacterium necrophorum]